MEIYIIMYRSGEAWDPDTVEAVFLVRENAVKFIEAHPEIDFYMDNRWSAD